MIIITASTSQNEALEQTHGWTEGLMPEWHTRAGFTNVDKVLWQDVDKGGSVKHIPPPTGMVDMWEELNCLSVQGKMYRPRGISETNNWCPLAFIWKVHLHV